MNSDQKISLGFTDQLFEPGAHVCQIINDDQERQDALMSFLISGLAKNERAACFSDEFHKDAFSEMLKEKGFSYQQLCDNGNFSWAATGDVYFNDGKFDPDRMLKLLEDYYHQAKANNFQNARVIGEMTTEVKSVPGGERLFEYECRVSMLVRKVPVTAVCQYDARKFDGATIMDVLKVHPFMIVRGEVVHNPFFIPPEEFLAELGCSCDSC